MLVVIRMGAGKLQEKLPAMIEAVSYAGQMVTWVSDPMHGNQGTSGLVLKDSTLSGKLVHKGSTCKVS
jgi:3-deoxy-D-arabino-heptulosonate 7-phosphate (DAHP) synthase class II